MVRGGGGRQVAAFLRLAEAYVWNGGTTAFESMCRGWRTPCSRQQDMAGGSVDVGEKNAPSKASPQSKTNHVSPHLCYAPSLGVLFLRLSLFLHIGHSDRARERERPKRERPIPAVSVLFLTNNAMQSSIFDASWEASLHAFFPTPPAQKEQHPGELETNRLHEERPGRGLQLTALCDPACGQENKKS